MAAALAVSTPAIADDRVVDVSSVDTVAALLREAGYKADIKVAKDGDFYLESATGGNGFQVLFYGCKDKINCDSFEFFGWFKKEPFFSTEMANEWNANHRFLKVAIDADGDLSEYATIDSVGKMTFANFKDYLDWYGTADAELIRFVDEKRKLAAPAAAKAK
ncbi:MAG TPA: YbjN domain-containing protein [Sphingomonas sp.]